MKLIGRLSAGLLISVYALNLTAQTQEKPQMLDNAQTIQKMTPTQIQKNKETVRKLYVDCLNTGNLDLLAQLISDNYTVDYKGKKAHGPSGYAETIKPILHGFPDIQFTLESLTAEGDRVIAQWTSEGTHKGVFFGFPASGNRVINKAVAVFRLKDGKIVQNTVYPDRFAILQQIGAMPELRAPAAREQDTN